MIIQTFKLNRKIFYGVVLAILLIALILIFIPKNDITAMSDTGISFKNIRTNEDRRELLKKFGWEVSEQEISVNDVVLPDEFDEIYDSYNQLQLPLGLDLKDFAGKTVKLYTYTVSNHPKITDKTVYANLLISEDKVIGGDISQAEVGGIMEGLDSFSE